MCCNIYALKFCFYGRSLRRGGGYLKNPSWQLGPQFGYSKETVKKDALDSTAIGLAARYTVNVKNTDFFVGLHANAVLELGEERGTYIIPGGKVIARVASEWSIDLMPRVGYSIGDLSLSLAAGLTFMQIDAGATIIPNAGDNISLKDSNIHTGWKIAPGIDYKITEDISLFGQLHYAKYGSKTYTLKGGGYTSESTKLGSRMIGGRVGVLYSF